MFFSAPLYGSGGADPTAVTTGDLNRDGKLDLIVANTSAAGTQTAGTVSLLFGNGDGTFQTAVNYNSGGEYAVSVAAVDVNGDGNTDLVVANECADSSCTKGAIGVLLGNGDGSFQPAVTYSTGGVNASDVVAADVNSDGRPDLIVTNQCWGTSCASGGVAVLLGNGDGTFQPAVTYQSGGLTAMSVAIGDLNRDGKPDLIVLSRCSSPNSCGNGVVSLLLGNGDGTFQNATSFATAGQSSDSMALANVNGDGNLDLIITSECAASNNCGYGALSVLLGNGDGTFQPAVSYSSGGQTAFFITVGDVNGDGRLDLAVVNQCPVSKSCSNTVGILLGKGDGTFAAASDYFVEGAQATSLAVADMNGDGKIDIAVADQCASATNCSGGILSVLFGGGDGTFQAPPNYAVGAQQADSVVAFDLNRDGIEDLVVASQCADSNCANGSVSVLIGVGDGTFRPPFIYNSGGIQPIAVAVKDLNGDGKPDIVVENKCVDANCSSGSATVLLGNGDGSFQPAIAYATGGSGASSSLAIADVNGDGKPDLIVSNACADSNCSASSVSVLRGNGDGTFLAPVSYGSGSSDADFVAIGDVNGDGVADLIVAHGCLKGGFCPAATVSVLLGKGDGTFNTAALYAAATSGSAYSVALGDMNGDGKPDLVLAVQCSDVTCVTGGIAVLLGNGDGTFQSASNTPTNGLFLDQTQTFALTDFNGDGKLDVASAAGNVLLLGNGDGTFQTANALGPLGPGIFAGDFNLDGRPDVAIAGGSSVTVLRNVAANFRFSTTTTLTTSQNPSVSGASITFTATVAAAFTSSSGRMPTGIVTLSDGSTVVGAITLVNGSGSLSLSSLAVGSHNITALYGGDPVFSGSASPVLVQVVNKVSSSVTVTSNLNPAMFGQAVAFTAVVTTVGSATGTVAFQAGGVSLGTVALIGNKARLSTSSLLPATYAVTAVYSGDATFSGSTSVPLSQVINKASTTSWLQTLQNPSATGQSVTFKMLVTSAAGIPTGTVTLMRGTVKIASASLNKGGVSMSVSNLPLGSDLITASYSGSPSLNASSSSLTQVVSSALPACCCPPVSASSTIIK